MADNSNSDSTWYDSLQPFNQDAIKKYQEDQESKGRSLAYLIHKTFVQNEEGAELLARWREIMEMVPVVEQGIDLGEIGAREGYNRFIRSIIRSIKQVEKGEK